MPRRREPLGITPKVIARLWAKVDKTGECWIWTGNCDKYGRSTINVNRKQCRPRRLSYELTHGPIPPNHEVYAECANKWRCVRPDHLVCRQQPVSDFAERFWSKVDRRNPDECWEWQADISNKGYGRLGTNKGGGWQAHRAAWELTNGPIPNGMFVCHRCDNPPCVNPAHLFLGTPKDNVQDMLAKGRAIWQGGPGWPTPRPKPGPGRRTGPRRRPSTAEDQSPTPSDS